MVYDYDGSSHKNISIGGDKRKMEHFINDDAIKRSRSSTDSDCVNINMNEFMAQRRKHAQEEYTQIRNELACKKWGPQTQNILPITSIIMDHPTGKTSIWNRNVNFVLQVVVIQIYKWMEEKSLSPTYIVQMEVKHLQIYCGVHRWSTHE